MSEPKSFPKKVVVLGMDALDPNLLERFIKDNKLPNFSKLKNTGTYARLETTNPPQSEVAWSSFATGLNPGGHGVFDFIMRDPKTYSPFLSLNEISNEPAIFNIGPIRIPLLRPKITTRRKGICFWEIASQNKIPTYIYFCPNTFPPDKVYGRMISGMGVPDIRGTMGTFSFYTTAKLDKNKHTGGLVFHVEARDKIIDTTLYGPRDISKKPARDIQIPMKIKINSDSEFVIINIQKNHIILKKGHWSDWIKLNFKIDIFKSVNGICRFYLKNVYPELELYCSAINFDPRKPAFTISYPRNFARELSRDIGLYHTQGMPYDTWALNEGRIDEDIFLEQANSILKEREAILRKELKRFKGGLFFFYFGYPDIIQHMFWHYQDQQSHTYDATKAAIYGNVILQCYQKMDEILGWVMKNIDSSTALIVLSDHGFNSFHRTVHVNSWLRANGFLFLKDDNLRNGGEFFKDVDWSRTKAYALGFGGIYINQRGREGEGIVSSGNEKEQLKKEISDELYQWRDSAEQRLIVKRVYTSEEIFNGPCINDAPDLFIGFNEGYRASWQTALGAVPESVIEDNLKPWSGDHLFDPSVVPGIFLVNQKLNIDKVNIVDIKSVILQLLGIQSYL